MKAIDVVLLALRQWQCHVPCEHSECYRVRKIEEQIRRPNGSGAGAKPDGRPQEWR